MVLAPTSLLLLWLQTFTLTFLIAATAFAPIAAGLGAIATTALNPMRSMALTTITTPLSHGGSLASCHC